MPSSTTATGDEPSFQAALEGLISRENLEYLQTTVLHPSSPLQILRRHAQATLSKAFDVGYGLAAPYVDAAADAAAASPQYVSLAVFLVLLYVTWVVLGWVRRVTAFVTRLVFRLLFWSCVVAIAAFVVQNGVLESAKEAFAVAGKVAGYVAVLKDVLLSADGPNGRGGSGK